MIKPFKVEISEESLQNIYSKVKNYQWHEMPDDGGWDYGTNLEDWAHLRTGLEKDLRWTKVYPKL